MRMSRQSPGDLITFPYTGFLQIPNISGGKGAIEGAISTTLYIRGVQAVAPDKAKEDYLYQLLLNSTTFTYGFISSSSK